MAGRCPDCGGPMKPLAFSEYCPKDCDRKQRSCDAPPAGWSCSRPAPHDGPCAAIPMIPEGPPAPADFTDEEDTPALGIDWADLLDEIDGALAVMCPNCGAMNTEEFPNCNSGNQHCLPCGHVWYR